MKKKYEAAVLEIIRLQQSEVISTSTLLEEDPNNDGLGFDFGEM